MSESLKEETLTVEQTVALNDTNDAEVVKTQDSDTPREILNVKPNYSESYDENIEKVPLENVPAATTEIEVNDIFPILQETPQNQDLNESQKATNDTKGGQNRNEDDISCVAANESINLPQESSPIKTNIVDNHDKEVNSAVPESLENKSSTDSIIKEDTIDNEDKVKDITCVTESIPLKTCSLEKSIEETPETLSESTANKDNIASPAKSLSVIVNEDKVIDASSSSDKDSSKTITSLENPSSKDEYAEHVTYTEDGSAIYTDPQTKYQYKWSTTENNWIPCDANSSTTNPYENEHYKWCSETEKWIPKNTQVTETEHYKWDAEKNEWVAKVKDGPTSELTNPTEVKYEIDKEGQRTYTDKDGTVFFWDAEKNAWFPKIDDDFMARYQMSYGFIDNTSASLREKEELELKQKLLKEQELERLVAEAKANDEAANDKKGVKRKAQQEPPKWFDIDPAQNTKVYVTNLPLDITLDEFADVMGKCGMIMRDSQSQKYKLKLYTEADGQVKGDGLCDYIKVESVDLALKILDEYELRGHKIRVQRAKFQMRGEYNPALKPKRKKKDKEKLAKIKEKLFDWRPEKMRGERSKNEKTVIIKNLFHPELFEKEVQLILDYQTDLREECAKCGTVRKVVIYDRHSEGVAQINMSSPEEADLVIQMMHGRYFGKRQLTAEHWDGKTKYKVEETEEDIQKRLNKWDQYLETEENKKPNTQNQEQCIEEKKDTNLLKQRREKKEDTNLQKQEQSEEPNENSNLQEQSEEANENSDLQKEEQDIEKTINFENKKTSQSQDL